MDPTSAGPVRCPVASYCVGMADVTVLHNPRCSTSRHALAVAAEVGADVEIIDYLKAPRSEAQLRALLDMLADPPSDLVRRDAAFAAAGLTEESVQTADQVVDVLLAHPRLLQRPVLVRGGRAIIGRPKERVRDFLA